MGEYPGESSDPTLHHSDDEDEDYLPTHEDKDENENEDEDESEYFSFCIGLRNFLSCTYGHFNILIVA